MINSSRREAQKKTRRALLNTAHEAIASGGINALKVRDVATKAGFTQGAFYSNFETRDDLLIALLEDHFSLEAARLDAMLSATDNLSFDETLEALGQQIDRADRQQEWTYLVLELQLHAMRFSDFAPRFQKVVGDFQDFYESFLTRLAARYDLTYKVPSKDLAVGLFALWSGLAVAPDPERKTGRTGFIRSFLLCAIVAK